MQEYKNIEFEDKRFNPNDEIKNKKFVKCSFHSCRLSVPYNLVPENRTKIVDCEFENCKFNGRSSFQSKGYFQNVIFNNIKNSDYMSISGVIFNQVAFKGKFDNWILKSNHAGIIIDYETLSNDECVELNKYADAEYKKIEWALDISEAEFKDCDLHPCIPAHLVKRNKETQILIKYEKAIAVEKKNNLSLNNFRAQSFYDYAIGSSKSDMIFVAPVRNPKKFKEYVEAFKVLRGEGIAELD
jgi:hypothetical protein